ncbi:hypothetical protein [Novosphingobium arvoryzae]|uniref:Uncharacterized protein n=1 Tax=Novosphingobium arvoryzae TaxID=1256514 RepID=A0A918RUG8_9SPHN|nr:hypothetical protein [Novosphingobium arvoryzae]GHA09025.1 hypothetical protein GCM10011617_31700 [Novosphingobium arvoryzae]
MLSKVQKPKTKQELIKALQSASIQSVSVYEGTDVNLIPSKTDFIRQKATLIVLR